MSNTTPETAETEEQGSPKSRTKTLLIEQTKNGSLPLLAGGTLIVRAIGGEGGVVRKTGRLFAGTALVGLGLRQRRQYSPAKEIEEYREEGHGEVGTVDRRIDSHEGDNPRSTDSEPDVDTKTDPDEGSIQFTDDQTESQTKPDLEDDSTGDPRMDDDDTTEIDISEASMADEPNEAAGPSSVQSQPTQTDSIEPEESPEEDASHLQAGDDEEDSSHLQADDDEEEAENKDEAE